MRKTDVQRPIFKSATLNCSSLSNLPVVTTEARIFSARGSTVFAFGAKTPGWGDSATFYRLVGVSSSTGS